MKILYYSVLCIMLSLGATAQETSPFTTGFETKMPSKILGEDRRVYIHIPAKNGGNTNKDRGSYPVLYLLDGSENFNTVVSITEHLNESGLCPPIIVVGILHPNRMSDLTTGSEKDFPDFTGKGEQFMSYVEKELIPYVDATYPTTSYRIFVGHSVGGLTVINTLIHQPGLFSAYVSLDGALWWNQQKVVADARPVLPKANYKGKRLYMAMANRMERGVDTLTVQKDTSGSTFLLRSNLAFIHLLNNNKKNQLNFKYRFYPDDNHPSIRLAAEYDALRFVFDFYRLKIYDSELANPAFKLDALLSSHYQNVSEQMGYTVKPDESQVNNLGYQMLGKKQYAKAEKLFTLNIANYPVDGNCYDSMGDLYLATGKKDKAIESFKKALTLAAIPETQEKLEKLLKEKTK